MQRRLVTPYPPPPGHDGLLRGTVWVKICTEPSRLHNTEALLFSLCSFSQRPTDGTALEDLNPCPLNVCCNVWGQCGVTDDFCTVKKSETGAPGTSGDANGCVSSCGSDIVNDGSAPAEFRVLGYFEAWNPSRDCLHMDVRSTQGHDAGYTDVHFSFAHVSDDGKWDAVIPDDAHSEWRKFISPSYWSNDGPMPRRIVAFGGWAFSTDPSTYHIFREAVKEDNRKAFAEKVVDFVKAYGLDGVDFDWEYPGAPDIPGIPPGEEDEGDNYLAFLKEVRNLLPSGKSLSIAAPASYWYLKAFPIDKISSIVHYIVYMTYDLHGQWDSGSEWASPGCPSGNCLRSHVNWTETELALSMVTKAGVPTSKLLVGLSSYGRSFKMTEAGCKGPSCTFVGSGDAEDSPAKSGECTGQGGYLALAEIEKIQDETDNWESWYDKDTQSRYMVYEDTEWVAYMDLDVMATRTSHAKSHHFGGTIEWAVDLRAFEEKPFPGGVFYEDIEWDQVSCADPVASDTDNPGTERWAAAGASMAWIDAIADYRADRASGNANSPFTIKLMNFLNGPEHMNCQTLVSQNGCMQPIDCDEDDSTYPVQFIYNSFVNLENQLWNSHNGLESASKSVSDNLKNFVETFGTKPEEKISVLVILDIVTMGYAAMAAPMWNKLIKKSKWADNNGGDFDTSKDLVNDMTYQGVTLAKDLISESEFDEEGKLQQVLNLVVDQWKQSFVNYTGALFDGSDDSIDRLGKLINNGKLIDVSAGVDIRSALEHEQAAQKALYATLVPILWTTSKNQYNPFIFPTGYSCDEAPKVEVIQRRIKDGALKSELVCHEGRGYYLLSARNPWDKCCDNHFSGCFGCESFAALDGADELVGRYASSNPWSSISRKDIVVGSLNTWKANSKRNPKSTSHPSEKGDDMDEWAELIEGIVDDDLRTPGVFTLPICNDISKAYGTYFEERGDKSRDACFPCCDHSGDPDTSDDGWN